jgi:hypothetical protein
VFPPMFRLYFLFTHPAPFFRCFFVIFCQSIPTRR